MTQTLAIAVVALWDTKKFSTFEISQILEILESDVERIIHIRIEAERGIIA